MFGLLVSGYTICFAEEQFLRKELHELKASILDTKDMRFLLLNPDSDAWKRRAAAFVGHHLSKHGISLDHYKQQCSQVIAMLQGDLRAQTKFYDNTSVWRLYIFRDHLYASRYSQDGEPFSEGHAPVIAFDVSHPMYEWLFLAFLRRCPPEWKPDISKHLREMTASFKPAL